MTCIVAFKIDNGSVVLAGDKAGSDEFKLSQDRKLDICADYENKRGQLISGFFLQALGFPKQDIDNKCKIVLDAETNETFSKHEAKPIKL